MEAKTTKRELFQPQDKELGEILEILKVIEGLRVSEQGVRAVLLLQRRNYPHADMIEAATTVVLWASSPTFEVDERTGMGLLLAAIKKQPLPTQRKIQNAPQRAAIPVLRDCEVCDREYAMRSSGELARAERFVCYACLEKR